MYTKKNFNGKNIRKKKIIAKIIDYTELSNEMSMKIIWKRRDNYLNLSVTSSSVYALTGQPYTQLSAPLIIFPPFLTYLSQQ